jgi:hypothetical protein
MADSLGVLDFVHNQVRLQVCSERQAPALASFATQRILRLHAVRAALLWRHAVGFAWIASQLGMSACHQLRVVCCAGQIEPVSADEAAVRTPAVVVQRLFDAGDRYEVDQDTGALCLTRVDTEMKILFVVIKYSLDFLCCMSNRTTVSYWFQQCAKGSTVSGTGFYILAAKQRPSVLSCLPD